MTNVAANLYGLQNEKHGLWTDRVIEKSKANGHFLVWTYIDGSFCFTPHGETFPEVTTDFLSSFGTI
jgi:hypothetical protein